MIGCYYIDGVDIYTQYGVSVTEGGYEGLFSYPALKIPDSNDWSEEDGQDVDLSAPVLDSREFILSFCGNNDTSIADFIASLSDGSYHDFEIDELGYVFSIRLVAQSNLILNQGMKLFNLTFADDFPLRDYVYSDPIPTGINQNIYSLDDRNLADYGLWVLQGTEAELQKTPAVKKNLTINLNSLSGVIYDGDSVRFQSKDVTIKLRMITDSPYTFWNNYNAFLFDLTRPGTRNFYSDETGITYPCYYKNSSVSKTSILWRVWIDFSVTLCFNGIATGSTPTPIITQKTIDYGFLYNYAALANLAATNAHVATVYDWNSLIGSSAPNDADHLKEAGFLHWQNYGGRNPDNSTGFTALPGGMRNLDGSYVEKGPYGKYWCADFMGGDAVVAQFFYNSGSGGLIIPPDYLRIAFSVRLVVDTPNTDNEDGTGEYVGNDGQKYACKVMPDGNFWITKNLCETFLNDLTPIPEVANPTTWAGLSDGARCCYNNVQMNAFL